MSPKLADRLSKLLPLLASDKDFEVLAARGRIRSALASEKLDFHDLTKRLCSGQSSGFDASNFADWAADLVRREAERERERDADNKRRDAEREAYERAAEAERVKRAEAYATEKAAKAAARAAERATPQYNARVAQRRRDALARRAAEAAAEAERAEAESRLADRIAAEGPRWDDIGDAARRAWIIRILGDPSANLHPSTTEALNGIDEALAPPPTRAMRHGRRHKPKITWGMITPAWIAEFERAARDHTMRQRSRGTRP
jgi:hypothetical protein